MPASRSTHGAGRVASGSTVVKDAGGRFTLATVGRRVGVREGRRPAARTAVGGPPSGAGPDIESANPFRMPTAPSPAGSATRAAIPSQHRIELSARAGWCGPAREDRRTGASAGPVRHFAASSGRHAGPRHGVVERSCSHPRDSRPRHNRGPRRERDVRNARGRGDPTPRRHYISLAMARARRRAASRTAAPASKPCRGGGG